MKLKAIKHTCIYRYLLADLSLEKKNQKKKHELVERKETKKISSFSKNSVKKR